LDADVQGFFDHSDHGHLLEFIQKRWEIQGYLRLIQKWLKAVRSEDGNWSETKVGIRKGG